MFYIAFFYSGEWKNKRIITLQSHILQKNTLKAQEI